MGGLRERLAHDADAGAWHDGPRRYLLLRPDGLMGAFRALGPELRAQALDALAGSVQRHGGDSLRAYAASVGGDRAALVEATTAAAADLGWGRWRIDGDAASLALTVDGSPFAAGWLAGGPPGPDTPDPTPVCAPIRGMLTALAELVLGGPVRVAECACAVQGHPGCRFEARLAREGP